MKIPYLALIVGLSVIGALRGQQTIYIDPDYTGGNSDGTLAQPFTTWRDVLPIQAGNTYLQKRGTTCQMDRPMPLASDVTIGAYGDATVRPIINFYPELVGNYGLFYALVPGNDPAQTIDNVVVRDMILQGNSISAVLLFEGNVTDVLVDNCKLTGGVWGIRFLTWGPSGREDFLANYDRVLNCDISGCGEDGIYIDYTWASVEIGYTSVYDINRKYFGEFGGSGASQTTAPGDPVQMVNGFYNPWVHHCYLDKSSTEYKFALIISPGQSGTPLPQGIVEYNILIGQGRNTAAVCYFDYGWDLIFRGNVVSNGPQGIYQKTAPGKVTAYNNVFYNVNRAVTLTSFNGIEFYNNTMLDCGGVFAENFSNPTKLKNNLLYRLTDTDTDYLFRYNGGQDPGLSKFDSDYNLFNQEFPWMMYFGGGYDDLASWQGFGRDANSLAGDPLFVDPANNDYRLASGSPARDAGVVIAGVTPDGDTTPDIGAWMDELYTIGVGPHGSIPLLASTAQVQMYGPYTVQNNQWFETGNFLGTIDSVQTAPWLYSWRLRHWVWLPEDAIKPAGAWVYISK